MKVKTSITLSDEVLKIIDSSLNHSGNRSAFIEQAVWAYAENVKRELRNQKDAKILNKKSDVLNREAKDVLSYQVKF